MNIPAPNPVKSRLEGTAKQYAPRPRVIRIVREAVMDAAGLTQLTGKERRPWEKMIPAFAQKVNSIEKKREGGKIPAKEAERLIAEAISAFKEKAKAKDEEIEDRAKETLRKEIERKLKTVGPSRIVAELDNGYFLVKGLGFSDDIPGGILEDLSDPTAEDKEFVADNFAFQQWLGESLGNCLQIYRKNFAPHGSNFIHDLYSHQQNKENKTGLFGVLNNRGKPVAAIAIGQDGNFIESNGKNNKQPEGDDLVATEESLVYLGSKSPKYRLPLVEFNNIDLPNSYTVRLIEHYIHEGVNGLARDGFGYDMVGYIQNTMMPLVNAVHSADALDKALDNAKVGFGNVPAVELLDRFLAEHSFGMVVKNIERILKQAQQLQENPARRKKRPKRKSQKSSPGRLMARLLK